MPKKQKKNTRGNIITAAWQLFYEQGYENTTVDEIIAAANTSKGSFYHYFNGKDALLSTLAYLFDEKYEELEETMDSSMDSYEKLLFLNQELFFHRITGEALIYTACDSWGKVSAGSKPSLLPAAEQDYNGRSDSRRTAYGYFGWRDCKSLCDL